mmetsp:Transcript_7720/g.14169  ORF Transcript_7720/g.14169 Transcript_7720/m.14169 type:complete len:196 (-) Transcript_7720:61-648(-)
MRSGYKGQTFTKCATSFLRISSVRSAPCSGTGRQRTHAHMTKTSGIIGKEMVCPQSVQPQCVAQMAMAPTERSSGTAQISQSSQKHLRLQHRLQLRLQRQEGGAGDLHGAEPRAVEDLLAVAAAAAAQAAEGLHAAADRIIIWEWPYRRECSVEKMAPWLNIQRKEVIDIHSSRQQGVTCNRRFNYSGACRCMHG